MTIKTNIGLNEKQRGGVVDILSRVLADAFLLYTKTRNYHWNVTGPQFNDLHKFFEAQYVALAETIDEVAERIRALGEPSPGTMTEFLKLARLKEQPAEYPPAAAMVANLLKDHEAIVRALRDDIETCATTLRDAGTADFVTGLMEQHEKMAWMLRAFVERG